MTFALAAVAILGGCKRSDDNVPDRAASANGSYSATSAEDVRTSVVDATGSPLAGATISADVDEIRRVTRFSDEKGQFAPRDLPGDSDELSISYPGKHTRILPRSALQQPVVLLDDPDFRRHLPSNQWLELLPDSDPRKREFTVNCGTCHEISHDRITIDGRPRSEEQWLAAISAMRAMDAYDVIPPDFNDAEYAAWLAEHFSSDAMQSLAAVSRGDVEFLSRVEITEYALPETGSLPHDLVNGPDGRIWITAFFYDELWALTPDTGAIERFPVDTRPDVNAQPRALEFDARGTLWLVNGGTESVLRFDPQSGDYREIDVGMYAHSIDLGPEGDVWVNDYFAANERLARINPGNDSVTVVPVPEARRPASEGLPLPYGLQVDRLGRVYSTQLAANTLVRYDSRDGSSALWEMPADNSGPRRPAIDPANGLWIPEFNTGHIVRFDPDAETFERVKLGDASTGLYDIEINQANGDIWATGSLASTLIRYVPATGEVVSIPLPTEPAYTRHIAVDETTGDVWTAYSSLPPADPRVARLRFLP